MSTLTDEQLQEIAGKGAEAASKTGECLCENLVLCPESYDEYWEREAPARAAFARTVIDLALSKMAGDEGDLFTYEEWKKWLTDGMLPTVDTLNQRVRQALAALRARMQGEIDRLSFALKEMSDTERKSFEHAVEVAAERDQWKERAEKAEAEAAVKALGFALIKKAAGLPDTPMDYGELAAAIEARMSKASELAGVVLSSPALSELAEKNPEGNAAAYLTLASEVIGEAPASCAFCLRTALTKAADSMRSLLSHDWLNDADMREINDSLAVIDKVLHAGGCEEHCDIPKTGQELATLKQQAPADREAQDKVIHQLAKALYACDNINVLGDGCRSFDRDVWLIEEALKKNRPLFDALAHKQPWIPCSERMPTREDGSNGGNVLWCWTALDEMVVRNWNWQHRYQATHWMPIPPLPTAPTAEKVPTPPDGFHIATEEERKCLPKGTLWMEKGWTDWLEAPGAIGMPALRKCEYACPDTCPSTPAIVTFTEGKINPPPYGFRWATPEDQILVVDDKPKAV